MYPQSIPRDPLRRKVDSDPFYHVNKTASTSSSGPIFQPRPVRPIPGTLAWGVDRRALQENRLAPQDDETYVDGATYFPGADNSLGLFSTDPKYSAVAGSSIICHSRCLPPTPPAGLEIEDYEIEGGWSFDASGRTQYVPHGGITAVDEDEENLDVLADDSRTFELPPDVAPPPRPNQRPIELIPLSDLNRLLCYEDSTRMGPPLESHDLSDDNCHTTRLPLLDRRPLGDESNMTVGPAPPRLHNVSSNDPCNTTRTTCPPPTIPTLSQELESVQRALASITTASLDIVSLHAIFGALPSSTVAADRALCDRVGKTIHAVQEAVRRHRAVPAEQWWLRSASCRRKYDHRLMSLQRTLSRFHALCSVSPRVNRVQKLRKLLEQHEAKLADLAAKFNGMFDRLHERYLNTVLAGMCADIQRRVAARKEERKTARAARQYQYPFYRQGRRPSIVEVL